MQVIDKSEVQQVAFNQEVILWLIMASGPQDMSQIKKECAFQASGNIEIIDTALNKLIRSGVVVQDVEETDDPPETYYDLADWIVNFDLVLPLQMFIQLIQDGTEWPDAIYKVSTKYPEVDEQELQEAYDGAMN